MLRLAGLDDMVRCPLGPRDFGSTGGVGSHVARESLGPSGFRTKRFTVTASAEELDRDLPATLVSFVGAHLGLKNSLDRAKAEMDAAAKAAQAEARSKSKTQATKAATKSEVTKPAEAPRPTPQATPEPPKAASLFDAPAAVPNSDMDEEEEILAEVEKEDQVTEEIDEAA